MALQDKKIMPPPWLAYPSIWRGSILWRMGAGEGYMWQFSDWFVALSQDEKEEYQTLFPEPTVWKGFLERWYARELLEHGDFWVEVWQPEGLPKYSLPWLRQEFAEGRRREFCMFWKPQPAPDGKVTEGCLSQWWIKNFWFSAAWYCCAEQYMMAFKADLFGDKETCKEIMACEDPKQIKALGRKVKGFDQVVWDQFKYPIVLNGNWCKFFQNQDLREFLLSTGDSVLVEASPYDSVWGIHLSADSPDAKDPMKWQGQNLLGFALMEVRDELRRVTKNEGLCDWDTVQPKQESRTNLLQSFLSHFRSRR